MINCFTKAKRKLQGPKHKCCGGSPNCIVWVFLHFSSAFEPVCAWFSLSPVMAAGPAGLSELGAQAGAPSDAHSLLICVDQGLWSETATCSSAGAGGGSHPVLSSSSPSSQHTGGPGPGSCSPSFNQREENRTDKHPFSEQACFKSSRMKHFAS